MESFSTIFRQLLQKNSQKTSPALPGQSCVTRNGLQCRLCPAIDFVYSEEIKIKNVSLKLFHEKNHIPGKLHPLIPSPLGRGYRTNSKRRVFRNRDQFKLGLTDASEKQVRGLTVIRCPIEPATHAAIYDIVQKRLMPESNSVLRQPLNYVIIRGDYDHHAVLFSMKYINPEIVRELNSLSKELTREVKIISGVFVFQDKASSYYISNQIDQSYSGFRKLFGKNFCTQTIGSKQFHYSPLEFSQTNASITGLMVGKAISLLELSSSDIVFDLYCGYGLFGLMAAEKVKAVIGVEQSRDAIERAKENSNRFHLKNTQLISGAISVSMIQSLLKKHSSGPLKIILDPPRTGTAPGVIEQLMQGHVETVIHFFCNIESLPFELKRWEKNGFKIIDVFPFDMFPATEHLEILVLIKKI